jgi:TPR repeat protein
VDYHEAAAWARRAAEQQDHEGEAALAYLYEQGKGVPLNYVEAYRLYKVALDGGNKSTKASLQSLRQVMTSRQIAEANSSSSRSHKPD